MIRLLNTHTYFNPRSHEGSDGSLDLYYNYLLISIHAPTRGATFTRIVHYVHYLFQSTLPRGERPHTTHSVDGIWDFNPRSHEGSDVIRRVRFTGNGTISIHAPTRGATCRSWLTSYQILQISIHAPTRGATMTSVSG